MYNNNVFILQYNIIHYILIYNISLLCKNPNQKSELVAGLVELKIKR